MSKFLARKFWGVDIWIWIVLLFILALFLQSAWPLLVGAAPAAAALRDASKEMDEKAQALYDKVLSAQDSDKTVEDKINEMSDEAKLRLILGYKEKQDDTDDPYMD